MSAPEVWTDVDVDAAMRRWTAAAQAAEAGDRDKAVLALVDSPSRLAIRSAAEYAHFIGLAMAGCCVCAEQIVRIYRPRPGIDGFATELVDPHEEPDAAEHVAATITVAVANGDVHRASWLLNTYAAPDHAGIDRLIGLMAAILGLLVRLRGTPEGAAG